MAISPSRVLVNREALPLTTSKAPVGAVDIISRCKRRFRYLYWRKNSQRGAFLNLFRECSLKLLSGMFVMQ